MTVNDALKMFTEMFDMKEKDKKVIKKILRIIFDNLNRKIPKKCEECLYFHIDCYSGRECLNDRNLQKRQDGSTVFFSPPEKFGCINYSPK